MKVRVNPSTLRAEGLGLLSLPAGRQGLTLSGSSLLRLKRRDLAPPNGSTLLKDRSPVNKRWNDR
jgi:hypothetical protein